MRLWHFLLLLPILLLSSRLRAQADLARTDNGWYMSPYGRIHILVVYAEIQFDSSYAKLDPVKKPEGTIGWKVGKMPNWKQWAVAKDPDGSSWMTKYFRQASFGKFQVTGDVLDSMITIPISTIRDGQNRIVEQEAYAGNFYRSAVVREINKITTPSFLFGSKIEDFDRWTYVGNGMPNKEEPNGKIDLVMIVWRNIHVAGLGEMSGYVSPGDLGTLWDRHTDMYSMFKTESMLPTVIMRHEFSHMLYGGNNFHTAGGGVGQRSFMTTVGGWSNMSAADACSPTWNAWDRERMGWGNPENQYVLSTRCADTGEEQNGDMVYGQDLCFAGEYVIRDFVTTGDAIKIKLPHLPKEVRNQYLWLENHQRVAEMVDHDKSLGKGLYAYIQVGKDERVGKNIYNGPNNYLWPLVAQGSYDFGYSVANKALFLEESFANPLTGYTYLAQPMIDMDGDHKLRITVDLSPKTEHSIAEKLFVEGREVPEGFCSFIQYPQFGTQETAFTPDRHAKIGIAHNPAATPIYSHSGQKPVKDDNRRIYLNGLSVEVLEQMPDGALKIRIRWDDFEVATNVRWCGDIVLKEKVIVKRGGNVTLDQGLSPQIAESPQVLDGKDVFAEPTILEVTAGALLKLDKFANFWIKSGSTLLIRKGATVDLASFSSITVERGGHILVEDGVQLILGKKNAGINFQSGQKVYDVAPWFKSRVGS